MQNSPDKHPLGEKPGESSVETSLYDKLPNGKPSTATNSENEDKVDSLIRHDRIITIKELCNILKANFFTNIVTGDETWAYLYDPETKALLLEWHHPSSPKKKISKCRDYPKRVVDGQILDSLLEEESTPEKELEDEVETLKKYEERWIRIESKTFRRLIEVKSHWQTRSRSVPSRSCKMARNAKKSGFESMETISRNKRRLQKRRTRSPENHNLIRRTLSEVNGQT
ncbi:hypothetical protein LAZ67_8000764 [Cordylochernes scorpioides]|uniref:Uncharacterized protein n=1 Tax=Cordylochernes scorpioides TaxID=51811 RepID=A0ABY6KRM2_9ARAC|nr:hypothetical protein LAZ67_8000764 [Cordylochernes scorpioides]